MSSTNWLSLGGALLTAVGIALTLRGHGIVRAAVSDAFGLRRKQPVVLNIEPAVEIDIAMPAVMHTSLPRQKPVEEQLDWVEEQLTAQRLELTKHKHEELTRAVKRLDAVDAETSRRIDERYDELTTAMNESKTWDFWGLGLAAIGALLQVLALLSAF